MGLAFQLAYKNLIGAGLRTWLNVGILSFAFLVIIFYNGLLEGWNQQAKRDSINWEIGSGHLYYPKFDPFDAFSITDGQGPLPKKLSELTTSKNKNVTLTPILIWPGSIYPNGRMLSVVVKGIASNQKTLKIPTDSLDIKTISKNTQEQGNGIPIIIGRRMAANTKLKIGDNVLFRWRDQNGTFDALNLRVVNIFKTDVSTVDSGQIWMALEQLRKMIQVTDHATMWVVDGEIDDSQVDEEIGKIEAKGWQFKSREDLLKNLNEIIEMEKMSASITYILLLAIALLAIFDTQVLSVFRRQREIGTYIALGMTRNQVVGLFTVEGSVYSFFAMIAGCIVGIPIFIYFALTGIAFPEVTQEMGVVMAQRIFPVFGLKLVLSTIILVVLSATIVSFLPAKKIARMNPVEAIKGKLQ